MYSDIILVSVCASVCVFVLFTTSINFVLQKRAEAPLPREKFFSFSKRFIGTQETIGKGYIQSRKKFSL